YHPQACWSFLTSTLASIDWRLWVRRQLRHPLTYLLAAVLVLLAVVAATHGTTVYLGSWQISLHTTHNVVHLAYAILFVRLVLWWWKEGYVWSSGFDERVRPILFWHVLPLALWFLLPKRLGYWLWYLSPAQAGEHPQHSVRDGVIFYAQNLV